MTEAPLYVICDAGPLIHLDELDCLDLLADFQAVLVPDQVWQEVKRHRPSALEHGLVEFQRLSVAISREASFLALVQTLSLGTGEQAALSLAYLHPDAILLTDDAATRLAAETLGCPVHGSIGILLRAIRRRQRTVDQVLAVLRSMPVRSTLYIRPGLLQEIIMQVESQAAGET